MGEKLVIEGGKKLSGRVAVSGSKNSALPLLAATLLAPEGKTVLKNVPTGLKDIQQAHAVRALEALHTALQLLAGQELERAVGGVESRNDEATNKESCKALAVHRLPQIGKLATKGTKGTQKGLPIFLCFLCLLWLISPLGRDEPIITTRAPGLSERGIVSGRD